MASARRSRPPLAPVPDPFAGSSLEIYRSNMAGLLREVRGTLIPQGLLLTDLRALALIGKRSTRPTALAHRLDLTPSAATQIIDRLERRGFVRRTPDPRDRRATVVQLTPTGVETCRRASRRVARVIRGIASEVSPEGLDALRRGSEELQAVLQARAAR